MARDLHIECITADDAVIVAVAGEIDLATTAQLDQQLRTVGHRAGSSRSMVVDLRAVRFLSACGLTTLLGAHHRCVERGAQFCIVATHRAVLRPLTLVGLADTLCVLSALPRRLKGALSDRAVVAQARGIVMADRHLSADEALVELVEQSHREGIALRDLADRVVTSIPHQIQRTKSPVVLTD
jgi:anti-sigma B factor antagonist